MLVLLQHLDCIPTMQQNASPSRIQMRPSPHVCSDSEMSQEGKGVLMLDDARDPLT